MLKTLWHALFGCWWEYYVGECTLDGVTHRCCSVCHKREDWDERLEIWHLEIEIESQYTLTEPKTMEAFIKKIADYYCKDPIGAGVVIAWLTEHNCWYASVTRFPTKDLTSRLVVAKAQHQNMYSCIELLEVNWEKIRVVIEEIKAGAAAKRDIMTTFIDTNQNIN